MRWVGYFQLSSFKNKSPTGCSPWAVRLLGSWASGGESPLRRRFALTTACSPSFRILGDFGEIRVCAIMDSSVVLLKKNLFLVHTPHEVVSLNCFTTMVYDKPPVEFESTTYALRKPVVKEDLNCLEM